MKKFNIKYSPSSMTPIELLAFARNVVGKMTANSNFPTPLIALADIESKADDVASAIQHATYGNRDSRIQRDNLVAELKEMLHTQANYIRSVCQGDKAKLASSGYPLAKSPEPYGIPQAPIVKKTIMTGVEGQITLKWGKVVGANLYQVWMTDSDPSLNAKWTPVAATHRVSTTIDNLKSLNVYWFAISAIGSAGESAKSDPAKGIAA